MVTKGALKGAVFAANVYEKLGFPVIPNSTEERQDIIQAVSLGTPEGLIAFCKGIQAAVHHSTDDTRQLPCVLRHGAQRGNARARDVPRHGKSLHAGDADAHPRERTRPGGDRHAGHIVKRFIRELQNRFHHRHQRLAVRLLCVDIKFREYFSVLQKRGRGRRRRGIEC